VRQKPSRELELRVLEEAHSPAPDSVKKRNDEKDLMSRSASPQLRSATPTTAFPNLPI